MGSRFSWILDNTTHRSEALWDREVLGNSCFAVVPSMGSLVPGWLLAVPRRPMANLSMLTAPERGALSELSESIKNALAPFGNEVFCFEHGAAKAGSATGCGVDQAHLHCVPLPFDLLSALTAACDDNVSELKSFDGDAMNNLPPAGEYVAAWRLEDGSGLVGKVKHPVSQWIRRVIAKELGVEATWDYRVHPQMENVQKTVALMTDAPIAGT